MYGLTLTDTIPPRQEIISWGRLNRTFPAKISDVKCTSHERKMVKYDVRYTTDCKETKSIVQVT